MASVQHTTLAQKQTTDVLVQLFELDCSEQGLGVYTFTSGTFEDESVVYNGVTYTPYPIMLDGWELTSQGTQPRPKLSISNVGGFIAGLVIAGNDLLGAKLTRIRTLARFLDNGTNPDGEAFWGPQVMIVDRKSLHTKNTIEWELATPIDNKALKIPGRLCIKSVCSLRYRVWNAAAGVFDYSQATCPYPAGGVSSTFYFDAEDIAQSNAALDVCSHRLTGCKARYGANGVLPFGGFPGMRRI